MLKTHKTPRQDHWRYAIENVGYVVDDAGAGRRLGEDMHAIVRLPWQSSCYYGSVLVGWQAGFETMFVAVHSYLDVNVTNDEAVEMATEYLDEIGWFPDGTTEPSCIVRPPHRGSLACRLLCNGYDTASPPTGVRGERDVIEISSGLVIFRGNCEEVDEWLREIEVAK